MYCRFSNNWSDMLLLSRLLTVTQWICHHSLSTYVLTIMLLLIGKLHSSWYYCLIDTDNNTEVFELFDKKCYLLFWNLFTNVWNILNINYIWVKCWLYLRDFICTRCFRLPISRVNGGSDVLISIWIDFYNII